MFILACSGKYPLTNYAKNGLYMTSRFQELFKTFVKKPLHIAVFFSSNLIINSDSTMPDFFAPRTNRNHATQYFGETLPVIGVKSIFQ